MGASAAPGGSLYAHRFFAASPARYGKWVGLQHALAEHGLYRAAAPSGNAGSANNDRRSGCDRPGQPGDGAGAGRADGDPDGTGAAAVLEHRGPDPYRQWTDYSGV